jgi:uncharacterized protein
MDYFMHNFLGSGWKFPIEFETSGLTVAMLTGEEDIQNSLDILFATECGERIMHPDYGCELSTFLFSPMNRGTLTYMHAVISDAILFNEPRIVVNEVIIEPSADEDGKLNIQIDYTISATNNRYNYVYPFYLKEATNLQVNKSIVQPAFNYYRL